MGTLSMAACVFSLNELIKVLIVVQAIFQFAAQCVAVVLMRRRNPGFRDVYRMPLYPLPAVISLIGWIYIVVSSGLRDITIGLGMAFAGFTVYIIKARHGSEWPFEIL
jgi:hypothetical protein